MGKIYKIYLHLNFIKQANETKTGASLRTKKSLNCQFFSNQAIGMIICGIKSNAYYIEYGNYRKWKKIVNKNFPRQNHSKAIENE